MAETESRPPMEAKPQQSPPPPTREQRREWDRPKPGELADNPEHWREKD
ncbi:MAG: hypothetical protein HYV13_02655 [Candidatus Doudnabacteria bacterium]|nr:hypothetical protein [Candidatus Doudnabacteria bacterium]